MTLIGSYQIGAAHAVVGDLMISGGTSPLFGKPLPALGVIKEPIAPYIYFQGLRQKVCILAGNLIVAWAGPSIQAACVLQILQKELQGKHITNETVKAALDKAGKELLRGVSLVGLGLNEAGKFSFGWRIKGRRFNGNGPIKELGECLAAGTGANALLNELSIGTFEYIDDDVLPSPEGHAAYYGLSIVSGVLGREVYTGADLAYRFGGGYELATFTHDGPQKVGDVLHLFWRWDKQAAKLPSLLPLLIKSDYIQNDLVIRRVFAQPNSATGRLSVVNQHTHLVRSPLEPDVTLEELGYQLPDWTPLYLCNYYDCINKGKHIIMTSAKRSKNKDGHIRLVPEGSGMRIQFNKKYVQREIEHLIHTLSNHPNWNE